MEEFKINLLKVIAKYDAHSILFWRTDLFFAVNCNDVFCWGFADCEEISSQQDVDLLSESFEQLKNYDLEWDSDTAAMLYAAKKRQMRPQGAMYEHINEKIHHLFDACGSIREVSFGNPKPQPKRNLFDELKEGIDSLKKPE